ncbi:MAG: hypothetical protein AAF311_15835, partial [Pseudomonadota bacterium]
GREAAFSPFDLALGWGPMSDKDLLQHLSISQGGRFYRWRYSDTLPLAQSVVVRSSANMHIVPANDQVARQLRRIERGDVVTFKGKLINIEHPDGWRWRTSTHRRDTGNGAYEIVLVEELTIRSGLVKARG